MFVVVVAALVAFGWWIWQYSRSKALSLPLSVGAAFDISGSMQKDEKQRAVGVLYSMIDTIVPNQTPTRLWVYAEKIHESMDKRPTRSSELNSFAKRKITERLGEWGTYQKLPLQAMLDYAKAQPNRTVVLCLFTDGEDHTPEETRRLAEQISQQPNVRAVLVGPLEDQFRKRMREQLDALDRRGKLILFGMNDADRALDDLSEKLAQRNKEARQ
jgi:predicted metal-dependent peptidase